VALLIAAGILIWFGLIKGMLLFADLVAPVNKVFPELTARSLLSAIYMLTGVQVIRRKPNFYLVSIFALLSFVIEELYLGLYMPIRVGAPGGFITLLWSLPAVIALFQFLEGKTITDWFQLNKQQKGTFTLKETISGIGILLIVILLVSLFVELRFQNQI